MAMPKFDHTSIEISLLREEIKRLQALNANQAKIIDGLRAERDGETAAEKYTRLYPEEEPRA